MQEEINEHCDEKKKLNEKISELNESISCQIWITDSFKHDLQKTTKLYEIITEIDYYDPARMKEIKSKFSKIPNEMLELLSEFLAIYKFLFVKEWMKHTSSMEDIKMREWWLAVIEAIRWFYMKNRKEETVERF